MSGRPQDTLSALQIPEVSRWLAWDEELALSVARDETGRPAKRTGALDLELDASKKQITELVKVSEAAPLL